MNITIYTVCWNEEIILPYFFKHYKARFPDAKFVVYDNMSTDSSREIIYKNGGNLIDFDTNNEVREDLLMGIRNNCWKQSETDWVIVCDVDEFVDVDAKFLERTNCTIIKTEGYEMVGTTYDLEGLNKGTRNDFLDKCIIFNKSKITEINFSTGSHSCLPQGEVIFNDQRVVLKHMKYFHPDYSANRFQAYSKRLSKENLENGWSLHYLQKKDEINNAYKFLVNNSGKVPYSFFKHLIERKLNKHRWFDNLVFKLKLLPGAVRKK